MESGNLKQALSEIKAILNTPLKLHSATPSSGGHPPNQPLPTEGDAIPEGDLPGQLTRVLGKGMSSKYC